RYNAGGGWSLTVEIEVEFQHVYNRFAEEAKLPARSMRLYQAPYLIFTHSALLRHTRYLEFGSRGRDVRIETRPRSRHQVNRHRLARIFRLQLFGVGLDAVN